MVRAMTPPDTGRLCSPAEARSRPRSNSIRRPGARPPTVLTGDATIADFALAAGAAAGVDPMVTGETGRLAGGVGGVVCVGVDRVERVAQVGLPRDAEVLLLGRPEDEGTLCQWSAPLGASVVLIPDGIRWLTQVFAGGAGSRGTVIGLVGGSGGVGTSTTALGLAAAATRRGLRSLLVDLDATGGGLDLLCGVESDPGWRWPRLATVDGFLGDLAGELPTVDEIDLISMGRGADHVVPGPASVSAVIRSAARSHDVVIVDLGRCADSGARQGQLLADRTVLVGGSGVRQIAAAGHWLRQTAEPPEHLLVRSTRHGEIDADTCASILELPCVGSVPDDTSIMVAQSRGESPARAARRRWRKACDRAVVELLPGAGRPLAEPRAPVRRGDKAARGRAA